MTERDSFARSSAARAWQEAKDANARIEGILERLDAIEPMTIRALRTCAYCGAPCLGPVCAAHSWTLEADNLAPENAA